MTCKSAAKVVKPKKQRLTLVFTTGAEEVIKTYSWTAYEAPGPTLSVTLYDAKGSKTAIFTNVRCVFKTGMLSK